jgi:menaquinone-dependent protoporphyrinogen oxidase
MSNTILVTYASRAGSTAEIAEAIGKTLSESGAQVDVMPMNAVKDLSAYRAVVAGSAIRGSKWLPEAIQFIQTHQSTLKQRPFAMFTVCITLAMKNAENYRAGVESWVAPVRALVKPLDEGFFAGLLDFKKLPVNWDTLMLRLTVALGIFPRGDHRDWNAVHNWAKGLASVLSE